MHATPLSSVTTEDAIKFLALLNYSASISTPPALPSPPSPAPPQFDHRFHAQKPTHLAASIRAHAVDVTHRALVLDDPHGRGRYVFVPPGYRPVLVQADRPVPDALKADGGARKRAHPGRDIIRTPSPSMMTPQQRPHAEVTLAHIKRPANAYILYRQHIAPSIRLQNPTLSFVDVSRAVAERWACEREDVKREWYVIAQRCKEEHARMYPGYKFKPRRSATASSTDKSGSEAVMERDGDEWEDVLDAVLNGSAKD